MTSEDIKQRLALVFEAIEKRTGPLENAFIAGGCIASMVLNEVPRDYDIWFESPETFEKAIVSIALDPNVSISKYAHSFEVPNPFSPNLDETIKIQLVQSRMGPPDVLTKKFDYKHTHSYYTRSGLLVCDEEFIKSKQLVYVKGNFDHPVNTMQRMLKFQRRGYEVPTQTIMDLMDDTRGITSENIYYSGNHGGSC